MTETTDLTTSEHVVGGLFWGGLIGAAMTVPIAGLAAGAGIAALRSRIVDEGIDRAFVDAMRHTSMLDTTTLVMLVSNLDRVAVAAELNQFPGARHIVSDFPPSVVATIEAAMGRGSTQNSAESVLTVQREVRQQ